MCLRSSEGTGLAEVKGSSQMMGNHLKRLERQVVEVFITAEEFGCCQMNNGGPWFFFHLLMVSQTGNKISLATPVLLLFCKEKDFQNQKDKVSPRKRLLKGVLSQRAFSCSEQLHLLVWVNNSPGHCDDLQLQLQDNWWWLWKPHGGWKGCTLLHHWDQWVKYWLRARF